jgi:hypothetical protein
MRQHNATVAFSINVGVDESPVLGRKRDALLRRDESLQYESRQNRRRDSHGRSVLQRES